MMAKGRHIRPSLLLAIVLPLVLLGGAYFGMQFRWYRSPYPQFGKVLAWTLGSPEDAYNFGVVVPGRVYRSGRPDERFIQYLRNTHDIQRIVTLTGSSEAHEAAKKMGMEVSSFRWNTNHLPPLSELETVLDILNDDRPVLVHCAGGSDRTGYTVAIYRVRQQKWSIEQAVEEMALYWHSPDNNPGLHEELRKLLTRPAE